jgi:NhaP-type Na+/H+ or K+/H+ antiporter
VTFLLVFSLLFLFAVLISQRLERGILSCSILFLFGGLVCGDGALGLLSVSPKDPMVAALARLALFSTLVTEGAKLKAADISPALRLAGRALLAAMPLTLLGIALLAHFLLDIGWGPAFLVGTVLSPTDPVFAAAIVRQEQVPYQLRRLLNIESGVNDGLALPVVMILLARLGAEPTELAALAAELLGGVALGLAVAFGATWLERRQPFSVAGRLRPLFGLSVAMLVFSVARTSGVNEYLAAFSAGVMLTYGHEQLGADFVGLGDQLTEVFKLLAVFALGVLLSTEASTEFLLVDLAFALLTLFITRIAAMQIALVRSPLNWRERMTAAWFGPKGFASIAYAILVLQSGLPSAKLLFDAIALTVTASICLHSSTDTLVASWLGDHAERPEPAEGRQPHRQAVQRR